MICLKLCDQVAEVLTVNVNLCLKFVCCQRPVNSYVLMNVPVVKKFLSFQHHENGLPRSLCLSAVAHTMVLL
jgi:hypothetical protein